MRKLRKAAVVIATLPAIGLFGVGAAHADIGQGLGNSLNILQGSSCMAHDVNVDVLGEVGVANGLQTAPLGSSIGCSNQFAK
ncbi:hypothetical protein ACWC2K_29185 [Streptomyces chattanoogensis]|uniref:hypothetical protein n=1 Tax=Streptomyces chattanoogensis TaxID=66876 RepID=UPI0036BF4B98